MILLAVSTIKLCPTTLLYELHDKRDTNSSMNQPPNYQEIGSFSLFAYLHTYKNLPGITVFRKLKYPDPPLVPLPAEVKECSQKSIRLTSYILI